MQEDRKLYANSADGDFEPETEEFPEELEDGFGDEEEKRKRFQSPSPPTTTTLRRTKTNLG